MNRQYHYDIVFLGHLMTTHALGALALRNFMRVPYVILCHGSDIVYSISNTIDKIVARILLRHSSLLFGNSRFTAGRIREAGYCGPTVVLNPGVDLERFNPYLDTTHVKKRYNLNGHKTIMTVGRLVERKNVKNVLYALPRVVRQVPNLLYLIVGEGETRGSLEALSAKLGLQSHVRFLGPVEDNLLPGLYCASDLFIMPSFEHRARKCYEGFGIVFNEAGACAKPVIAGRSGGTEDAVIHGETGLLVDPCDTDAIASEIVRLLTDQRLSRRLGEEGRRRVAQEYSWEDVGKRLDRALRRIVTKTATPG